MLHLNAFDLLRSQVRLTLVILYLDQLGLPHPDPVVENASLAAVDPPDIVYELGMPSRIAEEGLLSDLQLETVVYACQRHEVSSRSHIRGVQGSVCVYMLSLIISAYVIR